MALQERQDGGYDIPGLAEIFGQTAPVVAEPKPVKLKTTAVVKCEQCGTPMVGRKYKRCTCK